MYIRKPWKKLYNDIKLKKLQINKNATLKKRSPLCRKNKQQQKNKDKNKNIKRNLKKYIEVNEMENKICGKQLRQDWKGNLQHYMRISEKNSF